MNEFEWDENKRKLNLERHGIDFERAVEIWEGAFIEVPSAQTHRGEKRLLAVGESAGRIITVVFTWRGKIRRIISARIAKRNEREDYQKKAG
jgi:uncharacterized protein